MDLNKCLSAAQILHSASFFKFLVCSLVDLLNIPLPFQISTPTCILMFSPHKSNHQILFPFSVMKLTAWHASLPLPPSFLSFHPVLSGLLCLFWWFLQHLLFGRYFLSIFKHIYFFPTIKKENECSFNPLSHSNDHSCGLSWGIEVEATCLRELGEFTMNWACDVGLCRAGDEFGARCFGNTESNGQRSIRSLHVVKEMCQGFVWSLHRNMTQSPRLQGTPGLAGEESHIF